MTKGTSKPQPLVTLKETSHWKKQYLRILLSGPRDENDFLLAKELIDAGYAKGKYRESFRREAYGKIHHMVWSGVNLEGRLFADDLAEKIKQSSMTYKTKNVVIFLIIWLFGIASTFLAKWLFKLFTESQLRP